MPELSSLSYDPKTKLWTAYRDGVIVGVADSSDKAAALLAKN